MPAPGSLPPPDTIVREPQFVNVRLAVSNSLRVPLWRWKLVHRWRSEAFAPMPCVYAQRHQRGYDVGLWQYEERAADLLYPSVGSFSQILPTHGLLPQRTETLSSSSAYFTLSCLSLSMVY